MSESKAPTSILVLHDRSLDPLPFLQRLTSVPSLDLSDIPQWAIDNKYYTADVSFDLEPLGASSGSGSSSSSRGGVKQDVPVVLYLFIEQPPQPLPPYLTRVITSKPRDVAIAIRVKSNPKPAWTAEETSDGTEEEQAADEGGPETATQREMEWDEVEEMFLELGMEVMDECQVDREEDKLLDPLEEVRMTIQTHMWPNMVRKPLGTHAAVDLDFDDDDLVEEGSGESEYDEPDPPQAEFAIGFGHGGNSARSGERTGDDNDDKDDALWSKEWEGISTPDRQAAQAQFPSLEVLNQQLAETSRLFAQLKVERDAAEKRRMERLDRLERALEEDSDDEDGAEEHGEGLRFEEESGPAEGEWTRLEDWLDGNEDYEALDGGDEDVWEGGIIEGGEVAGDTISHPADVDASHPNIDPPHPPQLADPDQSFEDDFADFHSAPIPSTSPSAKPQPKPQLNKNGIPATLPMDPTPLLLHLQSVRAELAGVPDEDERRVRAAREVMAVLGLDMGDMDMDDLEGEPGLELREDEGWAAGPRPGKS